MRTGSNRKKIMNPIPKVICTIGKIRNNNTTKIPKEIRNTRSVLRRTYERYAPARISI
jgi:hypothetical protein